MHDRLMTPEIKALLISIGSVSIDPSLVPRARGSTAGPGAGISSVFFRSGERRVRLSIREDSPLSIEKSGDESGGESMVSLFFEGKELARGRLEPALAHCPEQAFITLCERCIFDCKYCPVPKLQGHVKSEEDVLKIVDEVFKAGQLKAISLTSGVEETVEGEVDRVLGLLPALKKYGVPIGVSVYPTEGCSRKFYEAGASEVKYNVETMDSEIFQKVCGGLFLDEILERLKEAVDIFGKNRVFSNFIIGLGETDDAVREGIETLAKMGVIPVLRPVSPHPLRAGDCFAERPSPERLLKLAKMEAEILKKYGLKPELAETMCPRCTGCDLVPSDL
ncbi:radical SAM protein [Methanosarcina sp. KYL-1]|uniref:radical SAM protein n=1 Tax=Methanosarcina sp. KYL-1 TaxID=2602068 RepID=UPI0021012F6F|nr:radical SAM protein [Methanosarcina sp. KYL-1]MCQ1534479.1 radical SAM protein [Methanosarcina sp. KYL-1]